MGQGIDWSLVKVDWEMPIRAMLEKGRQAQQGAATAMQGNIAAMRTQEDARQADMANALGQQQLQQQGQQQDQQFQLAQQTLDQEGQMQSDQRQMQQQGVDLKLAQKSDDDNFNHVKSMMALKMQADQAAGVLQAKDKQQAWKQYTDSITKLGQDPMTLGLPLTYNKDANDFLKTQLRTSVDGLQTGMQYGDAIKPQSTNPLDVDTSTPQGKAQAAMNKQILANDLTHINEGRKNIASFNNFLGQIPAIQQAAEDFDKYSLTGLSAAGGLGQVAAEFGAGMSDNQAKAAAAGGVINQWGKTIALLKKSLMPGSMSDSDRELLMSLSISTAMPKEEFKQKLGMIQGFMQRAVAEQSFKEAYLSQNGNLFGADKAWGGFMSEHPVVDSKTRQVTGDNDFRAYLGNTLQTNDAQRSSRFLSGPPQQQMQQPVLNQPSNMYGPTN